MLLLFRLLDVFNQSQPNDTVPMLGEGDDELIQFVAERAADVALQALSAAAGDTERLPEGRATAALKLLRTGLKLVSHYFAVTVQCGWRVRFCLEVVSEV